MQLNIVLLTLFTLSFSLFTGAVTATEIRISKTTAPAEYQEGFIRNDAKAVVVDENRGLMWQDNRAAKETKRVWSGAKSYCRNLTFAGYSDWYLPGIKELESIAQPDNYANAIAKVFQNVTPGNYWSSSEHQSYSDYAWHVGFKYGYSNLYNKSTKVYVRCVRAGQ